MALFNADTYRGKDVIYRKVPGHIGICSIWEWNPEKKKYERREVGYRYYSYKKVGGRQHSKCFEDLDSARRWRNLNDSVFAGSLSGSRFFKEVLSDFFGHIQSKVRKSTLGTYRNQAKHFEFLHPFRMAEMDSRVIDQWLRYLKTAAYLEGQQKTRISYEHEVTLLKGVFNYLSEYEWDDFRNPVKKRHFEDCVVDKVRLEQKRALRESKFLTIDQCRLFLLESQKLSQANEASEVLSFLAAFQLWTGTRVGEAASVTFQDINFENETVLIRRTVVWSRQKGEATYISEVTKSGRSRVIPIPADLLSMLSAWQEKMGRKKGLVFSRGGLEPLTYRSIQAHYNRCLEKIGVSWRSTHIMRCAFATNFLSVTRDAFALRELLGHRNMAETEGYAKVQKHTVSQAMSSFGDTFRSPGSVFQFAQKEAFLGHPLGEAGRKEKKEEVVKSNSPELKLVSVEGE